MQVLCMVTLKEQGQASKVINGVEKMFVWVEIKSEIIFHMFRLLNKHKN